jgi:hypothetical protein
MLLKNKFNSLVKVTHARGYVTTSGAEMKNGAALVRLQTSTRDFSLVQNMQIGF